MTTNGVLFRAHPDYRGQGPWFDYGMVKYASTTGDEAMDDDYPVRIAAIFKEVDSDTGKTILSKDIADDDGLRVLVQESEYQSTEQKENRSIMFKEYTLQSTRTTSKNDPYRRAMFQRRNAAELNLRIYCIEKDPVGSCFCKPAECRFDILVVKDQRTEWSEEFLKKRRY
jgi:hypothetical protein